MESNYTRLRALGIDLKRAAGQTKELCPWCSAERKNKTDKCLSVNIDQGLYSCHNCGKKGSVAPFQKPDKVYVIPTWTNNTALPDTIVNWFGKRKISQRVLQDMNIAYGMEYMPQAQKDVATIQFPYIQDKKIVNVKSRTSGKNFKLVSGAILVFYNIDAIKTSTEALIVEGEIDALSFIEAGYDMVVSVPNGASKGNQKLEYLDNCWQYFENKEKIYIGTDNDEPGIALRNELVRRLGDERCFLLDYKDSKDGNEYLVKHGAIALAELVKEAKPVPIEGIFLAHELQADVSDLYERGLPAGDKIGLGDFDEHLSFIPGQMTMVTGIPNHGKSSFLDYVCELLAVKHKWKFGVFSPENFPLSLHASQILEKIIGKRFGSKGDENNLDRMTPEERDMGMEFVNNHFFFIRPKDENYTLDNILSLARKLILKYGINALIIDPWNTLEHLIPPGISETTYISNQLAKLYSFKQRYNVHLFLVAHPKKMMKDKKTMQYEVPTLYDINMSANFFNKADNGFTVYRNFAEKRTYVYVQKVKFRHMGKVGHTKFLYDWDCGRFTPEGYNWDRNNHLISTIELQPKVEEPVIVGDMDLPF